MKPGNERPPFVVQAGVGEIVQRRPKVKYRVTKPYGPYVRGQVIEPTGVYRAELLARGLIEKVEV
jgi:hypothetical protein